MIKITSDLASFFTLPKDVENFPTYVIIQILLFFMKFMTKTHKNTLVILKSMFYYWVQKIFTSSPITSVLIHKIVIWILTTFLRDLSYLLVLERCLVIILNFQT